MNLKTVKNIIFVVWVVAIAILSIIPNSNEVGGLSFKLTESGMVLHFAAYFVGTALAFWVFRKNTLFSILIPGFTIFLYSVVLGCIQLYLPSRTFNPVDIVANASGIVFFSLVWMVFFSRRGEDHCV
mgnify:CR=1 FL=1